MCDPITLGTLAIGAAGTVANHVGQQKAAAQQADEIAKWQEYQDKARKAQEIKQEGFRSEAQKAAEAGLDAVGAENAKKVQADEAAKLAADYAAPTTQDAAAAAGPTSSADTALVSGEHAGGDVFATDLARSLADSAASAKARIGAMANVNAYGGSSGGLGTALPIAQATAGQGINLQNNFRKGAMSAYEATLAVPPVQVSYSNPIADVASSFLGVGMNRVGGAAFKGGIGDIFGGAVTTGKNTFPAVPMPVPGKVGSTNPGLY